jgi:hypothetical protein
MMGERQNIKVPPRRKYFFMMPNIYDDSDMTPHEFRLLAHYCRVGNCIEGRRTTARKTHMSKNTVKTVRDSLEEKGWISTEVMASGNLRVEVLDVWPANTAKYGGTSEEKASGSNQTPVGQTGVREGVKSGSGGGSNGGHKEEGFKKTEEEEEFLRPTGAAFNDLRKEAEEDFVHIFKRKPLPPSHPNGAYWWWQPLMRMLDRVEWDMPRFRYGLAQAHEKLANGNANAPTIKGPVSVEGTFFAVMDEAEDAGLTGKEKLQRWMDSQ